MAQNENPITLMQPADRHLASNLLQRAQLLQAMTFSLRQYLPAPLAEHCWVAAPRERTLVLVTDSPAWATQLRYQQQEILKLLNSEFRLQLNRLRIRIGAPPPAPRPPAAGPRLSRQGAAVLEAAAASIGDPELSAALRRLARRAGDQGR